MSAEQHSRQPSEEAIRERLRKFVRETFLYARPAMSLGDDDSLLAKGVIDSMGIMEMLGFLEEEFHVTPADGDITEEKLGSIAAIARYVTDHPG